MSSHSRATWKDWAGLATLALPTLLIGVDMTVLHLAVPRLSADLQPSSNQLLWIVDIYGFLIAGFLLTMGTLGDRIGRRKLLMIGAVAFAFASLFAAFSTSAGMLIVARALLGIAGATLMPSTLSLIRNMFLDGTQRTLAVSIWMMSLLTGQALGPLVGGALLEYFWWGSAFLISIPVMALLLVLAPFLLPEYRDPNPGRMDFTSVWLSLITILMVIYGLKDLARNGPEVLPILAIAFGVGVGVVFIRRQLTLESPMLDLQLFGNRVFSTVVATHLFSMFILAGMQFISAQHLQLVLELSPLDAGLWMVPAAFGGMAGALLAAQFVRLMSPAWAIASNLLVGVVGFGLLNQVEASGGLTLLITGLIVATYAVSLVTALTTDLIISSAPSDKAGLASGISETSAEFGIAMGVAVLGTISTAVYRINLTDSIPSDISSSASATALDTLGGAVAVARELPAPLADTLLESARDAFTDGLVVSATIGGVAMLVLAMLCLATLRQSPRHHDETSAPTPASAND